VHSSQPGVAADHTTLLQPEPAQKKVDLSSQEKQKSSISFPPRHMDRKGNISVNTSQKWHH